MNLFLNILITIIISILTCIVYDFIKSYLLTKELKNLSTKTESNSWSWFWDNNIPNDKDFIDKDDEKCQ